MHLEYILLILAFLLILIGVNMVYMARSFVKRNFPNGDINNATKGLKIVGVVVCCVGLVLACFNI